MSAFLDALPSPIRDALRATVPNGYRLSELVEVVVDLGRRPEARYISGARYLSDKEVTAGRPVTRSSTALAGSAMTTGLGSSAHCTDSLSFAIARRNPSG